MAEEIDDLVPDVVGGATRMQELVNDLLAYSPYVTRSSDDSSSTSSIFHGGGQTS